MQGKRADGTPKKKTKQPDEAAPLVLENHTKGPNVVVTAYDNWGHPVRSVIHGQRGNQNEREDPVEIVELLKHDGGGADSRGAGRKNRPDSFRKVTVKVNAETFQTVFEGREVHLEQPAVIAAEKHILLYTIKTPEGQEGKNPIETSIPLSITPSKAPFSVCPYLTREGSVKEKLPPAEDAGESTFLLLDDAGSTVSGVSFRFCDEAGDLVNIEPGSGWTARGGGWKKNKAEVSGEVAMPGSSPAPCTLNPAPSTLHPQPCTLNPAPCTLHPAPRTLNPAPWNRHVPRTALDHRDPARLERLARQRRLQRPLHHGQP